MFVGALEPPHLILVLVIVLVVFGPGKLPQLGKSLGDGIREFRRATDHAAREAPAQKPAHVAPAALTAATLRCGNCGLAATTNARYCAGCGATLAAAPADAESAQEVISH